MAKNSTLIASNVSEYLEHIFRLGKKSTEVRCYRGEGNHNWPLKPSVMRDLKKNAENQIFSELMVEAPDEFRGDNSMFDKLVRAQHYGLPTRLLDVSLNPLVGLYFACNEQEHHQTKGIVKVFDFIERRVKFADSDTISLICNLTRLSETERKEIVELRKICPPKSAAARKEFRNDSVIKRLSQFVRVEKPYFLDSINPSDLFNYFFVYPAKNNRRVSAQSGAFVAAGLLRYTSPSESRSFKTQIIEIPAIAKANIIEQLDDININSRSLFPEIEFASKYIKDKWKK